MKQTQVLDKNISFDMLIRFALPTIASMIFMNIYSTVDGIFVSRLIGTNALSAVNLVIPIILFSSAIGMMLGAGGNALIAKLLGEGEEKTARRIFSLLVTLAFGLSILLSIVGLAFLHPLLNFLGADEALFALCREYAVPILLLIPFSVFGMLFHASFITVGKAHLGLITSIIGGVTNIALDYLFIAKLGMGISGAAIATSIGYAVPSVFGLVYFSIVRKGNLYLTMPIWNLKAIWKSCSNGASEMVTTLSAGIVTLLLNNILMRLAGADGVASITIILYAQGLLSSAYLGYSFGISPIISYNYGKGEAKRLNGIYTISLRLLMLTSITCLLLSQLFAEKLVGIFVPKDTVIFGMAVRGYRMFAIAFLFMGFNEFSSAMFTALNNGKVSAILSFFRTLVFIVIASLILPALIGIDGVWLAIPLAELLGVTMTIYYFKKMKPIYGYA